MNTNTNRPMRLGFLESGFAWEQFQALIEAMPDSIVAVDEHGAIVAINAEAEKVLGYRCDQLLGRSIDVLLPTALHREHRALREQYAERPHARPMGAGRNLMALCADGHELPVDISLSPLLVAGSKIVLAALRDVGERRIAEESIRRLNDSLEERVRLRTTELEVANRQLEAYSYTVSHELRSPLRIVRGFSQLLHDELGAASPEVHGHLQQIADAARRMSQIVEGLLALARLDHHRLKCVHIDMMVLTQSVIDELRVEDPVAKTVDFTVAPLPAAYGDAVLLHQVLANLLSNAVKYCGKRASTMITVRGRLEVGKAVFQVQDNGPGFDAQLADSVFDPFQRLNGADEVEGLGIGLTLARRIVERHGGRIWAEGHAGGGATFSFWLPTNAQAGPSRP